MTPGESFIGLLLIIIAYFLYQIAKQLSYLTGKRLRLTIFGKHFSQSFKAYPKPLPKEEKEEKLKN